jgi:hypothetical protein
MVKCGVLFQVRTGLLNIILNSFGFKGLISRLTFKISSTTCHDQTVTTLFVFRRSRIQNLARRPALLTEVFYRFTQSVQANARRVLEIRIQPLYSITIPFCTT